MKENNLHTYYSPKYKDDLRQLWNLRSQNTQDDSPQIIKIHFLIQEHVFNTYYVHRHWASWEDTVVNKIDKSPVLAEITF